MKLRLDNGLEYVLVFSGPLFAVIRWREHWRDECNQYFYHSIERHRRVVLPEREMMFECSQRSFMVRCAPRHLWRDVRGMNRFKQRGGRRWPRKPHYRSVRDVAPDGDTQSNKQWGRAWRSLRLWWRMRHRKIENIWGDKFTRIKRIRGVKR